ncbi:MAG: TraB/GumN family protein [Gammaproteobacteria bacterium]|nr:TraB/GumN family protein [Gammaproteobacteria bacterium]
MEVSVKFKLLFYSLPFLLLFSVNVNAESPVWKIEKNGNSTFLGGTFHILTENDYPLPKAFDIAYVQSARVVFETDIQKLQSPEFQQHMLDKLSYTEGRSLRQELNEDTLLSVKTFFEDRGVPFTNIVNFKPGMVLMMMTIVELQRLGLVGTGVDAYFSEKAFNDRKKTGQLETVEEQLEFIANMGVGQEDEMLSYNMADLEKLPELWQTMKGAWRNGDLMRLKEIAISPLIREYPEVFQSLLIDRNDNWMPQIEAMLKTKEVEFVLVGVLHLAGKDGLLERFAALGYSVKQLR